ncbi:uncharacterized protein LOC131927838 [Physella acuta]|uniref:uncharacterized protein LOC131927838 n=1 Tax=Physella acuta TaxID=109671 RepID=UPI0027DD491D|nr:uncharacterized protein LOC131927838 [Physella acuta]
MDKILRLLLVNFLSFLIDTETKTCDVDRGPKTDKKVQCNFGCCGEVGDRHCCPSYWNPGVKGLLVFITVGIVVSLLVWHFKKQKSPAQPPQQPIFNPPVVPSQNVQTQVTPGDAPFRRRRTSVGEKYFGRTFNGNIGT